MLVLVVCEILYQVYLRFSNGEFPDEIEQTMTTDDFDRAVRGGKKYVILDDMVLDIEKFSGFHPGGAFALEHNVGRDISKFFHGGYALVPKNAPHTHSNIARAMINSLIVARLRDKAIAYNAKIADADKIN